MSFEQDLKDSLARNAATAQPEPDARDRLERTIRRAHTRRLTMVASFIVVVAAAVAVAIPQLGSDPTDGGLVHPDDSERPAPVEDGLVTFRDEQGGYQLRMPEEWRVTEFEGAVELLPPGQIGTAAGEDTFAVEIMLRDQTYDVLDPERSERTIVAGRPALTMEAIGGDVYSVDWPPERCGTTECRLQITLVASTPALRERYIDEGEAIVASIELMTETNFPTGEVRTRRGFLLADVAYDQRTEQLVRFLEARVHGGDAERFLAAGVPTEDLYVIDGMPYLTYIVSAREEQDGRSEFTVTFDQRVGSSEMIAIGPDGGELLVVSRG